MHFLEMRTVVFSQLLVTFICAIILTLLWLSNRRRFNGAGFWVVDSFFQAFGLLLLLLRGLVPDAFSVMLPNTLIITGVLLGYIGVSRFLGRRVPQAHNYVLLAVSLIALYYLTYISPDTSHRIIVISLVLMFFTLQYAWLSLLGVDRAKRTITLPLGVVFCAYSVISAIRLIAHVKYGQTDSDLLDMGHVEALYFIVYQMLFFLFTYSLTFMINRRLYLDLQTQEEKFSKAFHSSPYAVALSSLSDGRLFEINMGFEEITGYPVAEALGKTTVELGLWPDEKGRTAAIIEELSRNSRVRDIEINYRKKSGEPAIGLFSADAILVDGRQALLATINDITERKRSEERIRALLEEKELVLVEVHHRVKNNLNTIYSLLSLQASAHNDPSASAVLKDAAHRVRSMMLLYNKLYRSDQVTEISASSYLPPLIGETVAIFPSGGSVRVKTDVEDFVIKAKTASTLGIILNELVTNAMKYAVEGRSDPLLRLNAVKRGRNITIVFEDNGPGISESISVENSSGFGMQLINMLTGQLGGTVRIERQNGTRFTIEFSE